MKWELLFETGPVPKHFKAGFNGENIESSVTSGALGSVRNRLSPFNRHSKPDLRRRLGQGPLFTLTFRRLVENLDQKKKKIFVAGKSAERDA